MATPEADAPPARRRMALRIGDVALLTGLTADALRYYERIGLLGPIARTPSGIRRYGQQDLDQIAFILRARAMGFSLDETRRLLELRADPARARRDARLLTQRKLNELDERLRELTALRAELEQLVSTCRGGARECPIIDRLTRSGRQAAHVGTRRRS